MARTFRDAELPFKLIDVPELTAANLKWSDEYISEQFDRQNATGNAQESPNHFLANEEHKKRRIENQHVVRVLVLVGEAMTISLKSTMRNSQEALEPCLLPVIIYNVNFFFDD
jgi:hypothetical protein